jgi:general secretion pathway protein L
MNIETKRTLRKWRLAYIDPLQRSLHRAWSWWTGELMELMPPSFREFIERRSRRLLVEFMGNDLIILEGHADRVQVLKRVPVESANESLAGLSRGARDTALIVPSDKILSKALTLPLAAEENLYEVLGFEMDRHTPFSADQVYYDFSITSICCRRRCEPSPRER